ncbi:MAG: ABC transporter substrate-binding protein [Lachnospiraceae bacterium]
MKKQWIYGAIALGISAAMLMTGCASKTPKKESETGKNTETERNTTDKEGIVCYVGHGFWEGSMDPVKGAFSYGYDFINNALVRVNASSEYEGDLASKWEISEDSLSYTYYLKEGITFQDDSKFTAEDVVFTYETVMSHQGQNEKVDLSKLEKVEALNDTTVQFTLKEPYSPFLDTTAQLGIVPSDGYHSEEFDEIPVGTGPFKVVQYDTGQQLIVEANENYFEGAPQIQRVTFVDMDNEAAYSNAQSGQLDVVMVQPSYTEESIKGMHIEELETMDVRNISLPCREPQTYVNAQGEEITVGNAVTADVAVRKALSIGLNRQEVIDNAMNGVGKPAVGWTNNLIWGNTQEYQDGQIEEAQKVLDGAGWVDTNKDGIREKNGVKCEFEVYTPSNEQDRYMLATAVAENVKQLGISIQVKQTGWDEITAAAYSQGVVWGYGQYSPMVIDSLFQSQHFTMQAYSNTNGYENKEVDTMMAKAISANNQKDAIAFWKEAQNVYAQDYPYLYIVNIEHCYFVNDKLDISKDTQIPHPHGHGIPIICNMKDWKIK